MGIDAGVLDLVYGRMVSSSSTPVSHPPNEQRSSIFIQVCHRPAFIRPQDLVPGLTNSRIAA